MIAGVDEAGRGCLAGPVYAAAVVLGSEVPDGLNDSKKLLPARREELFDVVCMAALDWSIARAEVEEIDRINILQATLLAMQRAVARRRGAPRVAGGGASGGAKDPGVQAARPAGAASRGGVNRWAPMCSPSLR